MKKVFMSVAIVAMMVAAVACECNNSKKDECCKEATEKCEKEKSAIEAAADDAVNAVKDAATEKAVEGINAAADAAVEAIKK
ncbi:MAG: hypothetical protein J5669_01300 [Bacteroidales bacterium]|nr:hypothetical protein [Bacteroidales bacterium]